MPSLGKAGGALEGYFSRVFGLVWLKCALFVDAGITSTWRVLAPCWPPTRPPGLPPAFRALSPPQGVPRGAHRRLPARLEGRPRRHRPPVQQLGGPGRGCGSCRRAEVSGPSPCPAPPSLSPPFLLSASAWDPQARGGSPFGQVWSQLDLGPSELPVGRIPVAAGGCPLPLVSELREGRPTTSLSLIQGCLEGGEVGRRGHRIRAGPPGHSLLLTQSHLIRGLNYSCAAPSPWPYTAIYPSRSRTGPPFGGEDLVGCTRQGSGTWGQLRILPPATDKKSGPQLQESMRVAVSQNRMGVGCEAKGAFQGTWLGKEGAAGPGTG